MTERTTSSFISFILSICLSVFLLSDAGAEDEKFIYPINKTVIFVPVIKVVGKTGSGDTLTIKVDNANGETTVAVTTAEKYFSSDITLAPGRNTIRLLSGPGIVDSLEVVRSDTESGTPLPENYVPYYLHTKDGITGTCELCHPRDDKDNIRYQYVVQKVSCITDSCHPELGKGEFPHKPFKKGDCVECHNPHGSENKYFLKYFGSDLCFSCHKDAEKMSVEAKHIHFPVARGECTACHDPHTSNLEFHLKRETIAGLCAGCHGTTFTSHQVLHEPVESGDCIACHLPHISKNERLLANEGNDLCFNCHTVRKEEFESLYVHEPVRKDCTTCHDPHGSATIYHLRNRKDADGNYVPVEQPIRELCLSCHRDLDPEIIDQIENGTTRHKPVDEGKCTACHTPHSTNNKKQLKLPLSEVCYSCHKKKKKEISRSKFRHGPIRTDDCAQCHLPHGSKHRKLLRAEFSNKFSIDFDIGNYELCFICHEDEMVLKKEVDNTTGFRNGRVNLHFLHVNVKGRNCKTCHNIHASNQEFHIRDEIPFKKRFVITLKYTKTPDGGSCVEGCHKPRKYDRITPIINE